VEKYQAFLCFFLFLNSFYLNFQHSDLVGGVVLLLQGLSGHLVGLAGDVVSLLSDASDFTSVLYLSGKGYFVIYIKNTQIKYLIPLWNENECKQVSIQ
jgi:hypothetical protein